MYIDLLMYDQNIRFLILCQYFTYYIFYLITLYL